LSSPATEADAEAFAFGAAVDVGGAEHGQQQQQQPGQQEQEQGQQQGQQRKQGPVADNACGGAVEPETPGKGSAFSAAAAGALMELSTSQQSTNSEPEPAATAGGGTAGAAGGVAHGFEGDEPDWESASSGSYCAPPAAAGAGSGSGKPAAGTLPQYAAAGL
jgi:hypothetical protein